MIGKLMQKQRLDGDVIIGTKDISINGTSYRICVLTTPEILKDASLSLY